MCALLPRGTGVRTLYSHDETPVPLPTHEGGAATSSQHPALTQTTNHKIHGEPYRGQLGTALAKRSRAGEATPLVASPNGNMLRMDGALIASY
eukprot:2839398-Pyramimonas_sp.AAC.1